VVEQLGVTRYLDQAEPSGPGCRVLMWAHGEFRDRHGDCANPDDPEPDLDDESETAFAQISEAIAQSGVDVDRIEKGGWGPGTSFHLEDSSWQWNWFYSYDPDMPADTPDEVTTQTGLGPRLQVHITGDWWFTVEPDD
jgi:hypothetical protein